MALPPAPGAEPANDKLAAILQRLTALHPKAIDLSLDRILRLLRAMGNPHLRLPPVFHIAGSKGKGSTVAFLRAFAEAAGYRVHAYISPHLVRFNERIRLNGCLIEDGPLIELLERCEEANAGQPITFFEITTAAAYLAFAEMPADLLLLETGLGGRFDTTNVIPRPLLTALSPIGIDHVGFLGDTVAKIAWSKAGILKPGVPCVVGEQSAEALAVIEEEARLQLAPLVLAGRDWQAESGPAGGLRYREGELRFDLPAPALLGRHQFGNAALAIACARHLAGFTISPEAIATGLRQVEWPARMQRLSQGPLIEALPADTELWLDGAHNAMAGAALAETLKILPKRPTWLLVGVLNTKDAAGLLRPMAPLVEGAFCIAIPGEANSLSAPELCRAAEAAGIAAVPAAGPREAAEALAQTIRAAHAGAARVIITGSLYLAGRILSENG